MFPPAYVANQNVAECLSVLESQTIVIGSACEASWKRGRNILSVQILYAHIDPPGTRYEETSNVQQVFESLYFF